MSEFCIIGSGISGSTIANLLNKKYSVILFDKPDMLKGLGSRNFDSEGVKTDTLKLVDQGILKHYHFDLFFLKVLDIGVNLHLKIFIFFSE